MQRFDYAIVGSGPTGLAAAFELSSRRPDARILLMDKAAVSSGGLRNDCKMNFTFPIGFPVEYWPRELADGYLERVVSFLMPDLMLRKKIGEYRRRAEKIGVELLEIRQSHLGTDGGLRLIARLVDDLRSRGIEIALEETALDIDAAASVLTTDVREIEYGSVLVAPGRNGFDFLRKLMDRIGVPFSDNSIDVGLRIETREERYPIVQDYYDPKFLFPERVRTFCTNSRSAHVVRERYETSGGSHYYSVNGHAWSTDRPANGLVNFAVLRSVEFTEPLASGQDFAEMLGLQAMLVGGGKPIMQRVGDFRLGKRSTRNGFVGDLYDFEPTLKDCTPGDVSMVMPAKFLRSIWKALKQLDTIVPGVLHPSTIMYYPEIKLYANKPRFLDERSFLALPGIHLAGDGAGTSRGITAAWASGLRAADGMLGGEFPS
ncbi:MAG TPA: pyridine nucleotide-disulfide oxidoreductase [Treponema sp.]|nr:MAG: pyridine nucleotide-disulfide oxidoreductase [Treponema sp. GWC1_61_84]OHE71061.1 MAG: pyridine nucleotide-disulfide oxidoreductase [Treponema sp. RIFOXYC1_FULL_61_9]HCM27131.1 pyridine nucleotide-disulfide oxidoreductase [Treponema sp.]